MAPSEEEVLKEAMKQAKQDYRELEARGGADSGQDRGSRCSSDHGGGGRVIGGRGGRGGGSGQQTTGDTQEWATTMDVLFAAGEVEEGDSGEARAAEGKETDDGGDEGSSLGEDVDGTPSWVHGGFESVEAEQDYSDR